MMDTTRRHTGLWIWSGVRLFIAILLASALVFQFTHDLAYVVDAPEPHRNHVPTFATNFFSFFTNQSNILACIFLLLAASWGLTEGRRGARQPMWLAVLQVVTVTFMAITGIVYNLLLRGTESGDDGVAPAVDCTNELMHVWAPLFLVLDAAVAIRPRRVPWWTVGIALGYPLAYCAYTLIRAPFITAPYNGRPYWYPYPFLNPHQQGGWDGVIPYIVAIALAFAAVSAALVAYTRWRASRVETRAE